MGVEPHAIEQSVKESGSWSDSTPAVGIVHTASNGPDNGVLTESEVAVIIV